MLGGALGAILGFVTKAVKSGYDQWKNAKRDAIKWLDLCKMEVFELFA